MQLEIRAAAIERRPPDLSAPLAAACAGVRAVAGVGAQLGMLRAADPLTRTLMSWALLAPPAVVDAMQSRLSALSGAQLACAFTLERALWQPSAEGCVQVQPAPFLPAGEYFRVLMLLEGGARAAFRAMVDAHAELAEACAANLEAGGRPAVLAPLRARVADAAEAAAAARRAWYRLYREERHAFVAAIAAAGVRCERGDMLHLAWSRCFMAGLDQLTLVAGALLSAPAQQRDWLGRWLLAWRGEAATAPPALL